MSEQKSSLVERGKKDAARDLSIAEEAKERGDLVELHAMCLRLIDDRSKLANAFDSLVTGWSLLKEGLPQQPITESKESIAAIERVAHESIQFAREVVQAMTSIKAQNVPK